MDAPKIDFGATDSRFDRLMTRGGWHPVLGLAQYLSEELADGESAIDSTAKIHPAAIVTRSIIGRDVRIYENVTIRDSVVMSGCTVGHSSEIARSILCKSVFVPRFDYVGSSLIGSGSQLGGNVAFATKRFDDRYTRVSTVPIADSDHWKIGALVGRDCVVAFGVHINPGSTIGEESVVHPHIDVRGDVPPGSVVVSRATSQIIPRRDFSGSPYPSMDDWA